MLAQNRSLCSINQNMIHRDLVLSRLAKLGFDVRQAIDYERVLTPPDIERMTGAWRGALYGHSFNNPLGER